MGFLYIGMNEIFPASVLGIVTPWGGDALARLRCKSGAGVPQVRTGRLAV